MSTGSRFRWSQRRKTQQKRGFYQHGTGFFPVNGDAFFSNQRKKYHEKSKDALNWSVRFLIFIPFWIDVKIDSGFLAFFWPISVVQRADDTHEHFLTTFACAWHSHTIRNFHGQSTVRFGTSGQRIIETDCVFCQLIFPGNWYSHKPSGNHAEPTANCTRVGSSQSQLACAALGCKRKPAHQKAHGSCRMQSIVAYSDSDFWHLDTRQGSLKISKATPTIWHLLHKYCFDACG